MGLGHEIAQASLGVERLPSLPAGDHDVEILSTSEPLRTKALVVTVRIVRSSTLPVDAEYSVYHDLSSSREKQRAAQHGAVMRFVCGVLGARTREDAELQSQELLGCSLGDTIDACAVSPGPLAGQVVRVHGMDTGLRSAPSALTQQTYPIVRYYWAQT